MMKHPRKHPIFALLAILTAVYFPPEQDFRQLRSISACAHQQYCNINWISGSSIIITGRKSVPTTQPCSRVKNISQMSVRKGIMCAAHAVVRQITSVIGIPHCQSRLLLKPCKRLSNPRDHCILKSAPITYVHNSVKASHLLCSKLEPGFCLLSLRWWWEAIVLALEAFAPLYYTKCVMNVNHIGRIIGVSLSASFCSCRAHVNYQQMSFPSVSVSLQHVQKWGSYVAFSNYLPEGSF